MRGSLGNTGLLAALVVVGLLGCSDSEPSDETSSEAGGSGAIQNASGTAGLTNGAGGTLARGGGSPGSGGQVAAGGRVATGGAPPNNGGQNAGGRPGSGGSPAGGGLPSAGGQPGAGGWLGNGGTPVIGGGSPDQGGSGNGGSPSLGGTGSGGLIGSGGTPDPNGGTGEGGAASGGEESGGWSIGWGGSPLPNGGTGEGGTGEGGTGEGGSAEGGTEQGGTGVGGATDEIPMTIPTPTNGNGEIRNGTTVLRNGANGGQDVYDFDNQKIGVNNTSDCDDGEGQVTVFEVEDGVTVRNLIIAGGLSAGNGIVCKGSCTLEYVYWEDVCEDAATNSKDGATMILDHVIALHASDKVFQHNAKAGSTTIVRNSYVSDFGKLWRSCGDCTSNGGPRNLVIENVRVEGVNTAVAGANQNYGDTVTITDLFVKGGYSSGNDRPRICTEYIAVTDHNGESTSVNGGASQWNTSACQVSQSDVKSW